MHLDGAYIYTYLAEWCEESFFLCRSEESSSPMQRRITSSLPEEKKWLLSRVEMPGPSLCTTRNISRRHVKMFHTASCSIAARLSLLGTIFQCPSSTRRRKKTPLISNFPPRPNTTLISEPRTGPIIKAVMVVKPCHRKTAGVERHSRAVSCRAGIPPSPPHPPRPFLTPCRSKFRIKHHTVGKDDQKLRTLERSRPGRRNPESWMPSPPQYPTAII